MFHPLLDEGNLLRLHSGVFDESGLASEAYLVHGPVTRKEVRGAVRRADGRRVGEFGTSFSLIGDEVVGRIRFLRVAVTEEASDFVDAFTAHVRGEAQLLGARFPTECLVDPTG